MSELAWITGASSGIGEELARQADPEVGVIAVSRRPARLGARLAADLADPASWREVAASFERELAARRPRRALLLHCAGTMEPIGPVAAVDPDGYEGAVLLNAAAGQVLGGAFLRTCAAAGVPATLVVCSSPAAAAARPGAAQYAAGKAAMEAWARAVAAEYEGESEVARILCVVPHRVDTAMVRGAMEAPAEDLPLGQLFRDSAAAGQLATAADAAAEIWAAIHDGLGGTETIAVGAVAERRAGG